MPLEKPSLLDQLMDWFVRFTGDDSVPQWLRNLLILVAAAVLLFWASSMLLESVLKFLQHIQKTGVWFTVDKRTRTKIRKRQNFCRTLNGDLAVLAKKENWNDQFFADLEAEVEAEGAYYKSTFHRLIGKKVHGLRRAPSLIHAIQTSGEQALLLIGDPGSGKSVALRHLAHQMAADGETSSSADAKVPLYINLKEIKASARIDGDAIKQFVLDNIRRGDSDTAAFVKENWDDYRDRGIWFFLFDSFDEIPAVLHAPTGSAVVREYSEAIRVFLTGMGECRSVLASRLYKGPQELPWQKFRILPLSASRQEELVERSFLEDEQKDVVRQFVAAAESTLCDNPLFLTLICRYVKDLGRPPLNDLDLLAGHIGRLAHRDADYIERAYRLTPEQLMEGSTKLAVLFAEEPALSLAPTRDDIRRIVTAKNIQLPGDELEVLLAAVVDVKIGRSDVEEARPGDRRFTFSHRRYQETLFVRHLIAHPDYVSPTELLTNTRWRDYAVTLLQTQPLQAIGALLAEAEKLLLGWDSSAHEHLVVTAEHGVVSYFQWSEDGEVHLLTLLQEGMARRLGDIPPSLCVAAERLLMRRWKDGDWHDRETVVILGGLLPHEQLVNVLTFAVEQGTFDMQASAYRQAMFLRQTTPALANFVRNRVSRDILHSRTETQLHRVRAMAARLPENLGARYVVWHSSLLWRMLRPFRLVDTIVGRISPTLSKSPGLQGAVPSAVLWTIIFLTASPFVDLHTMSIRYDPSFTNLVAIFGASGLALVFLTAWMLRAVGEPVTLAFLGRSVRTIQWKELLSWAAFMMILLGFLIVPGAVVNGTYYLFKGKTLPLVSYGASLFVVGVALGVSVGLWENRDVKKRRRHIQDLHKKGCRGLSLLLSITQPIEILDVPEKFASEDVRSYSRIVLSLNEAGYPSLPRMIEMLPRPQIYVKAAGE